MAAIFSIFSFFYLASLSWGYANKKLNKYFFYGFVCLLSGVFSAYFSFDAIAYQDMFFQYSDTPFKNIFNEMARHELFFLLAAKILFFLPVFMFFYFYAILSFTIKLALIDKVSRSPILSLLCFFAFFFLYFDGTVVRVSLGVAVVYWGLYLLSKKNLMGFLIVTLLSSFFLHYSLIVFLIAPFFRSHLSIFVIFLMTFVSLIFYFFGFGILDFLLFTINYMDSSYIGVNKLISYLERSQMSHPYSMILILLFILSLIVYFSFKDDLDSFEIIAFNMFFLSFLFVVFLYQSQVFQNRISEMFRYSLVFIAPFFYYSLKKILMRPGWAMGGYCFFLSCYFFYYYYLKEIINDTNLGLLNKILF